MPEPPASTPPSPQPDQPPAGRAWQLLEEALKMPTAARAPFLERACADSTELRIEVQTLLRAVEDVESVFSTERPHGGADPSLASQPTLQPSHDAPDAPDALSSGPGTFGAGAAIGATADASGSTIGPFKLLSILGEGGFGIVFLAERRTPIVQRVAIKVIKPGMDTARVVARFEQERQVLAMMDHPSIAKVFDAGATATGRPYFVMEYVKGEPLNRYCDRNRLSIRQRLELFVSVCDAIQHAHNRGIIHRDLKPSNVLVSVIDDKPVAKVIDFGVAKAITHVVTANEIFTQQGMFIGTPEYMSPEQAEMGPTDIDTRTDVFSLGVMLYELLTGSLPIDSQSLRRAGLVEIQRMIREADRPAPSTRLEQLESKTAGSGEKAAASRSTHVEQLSRELRRELDWIPLKALRPDRTERYRSAAELADDIRNYLEGRAVIARPPSTWYSLRKFIRKNRAAVGALAAIFAALAIGGGVAAWKWRDEAAARREVEAQRASLAELVLFIGDDVLSLPAVSDEESPPLAIPEESIARAAESLKTRFAGEPALRAQLGAMLGRVYLMSGRPARAVEVLEDARAEFERSRPSDDDTEVGLTVDLARAHMRLRETEPAIKALEGLISTRAARGGTAPADRWQGVLWNELGNAHKWHGDFEAAEAAYAACLTIRQTIHPRGHQDLLAVQSNQLLSTMQRLKIAAKAADEDAKVKIERELENLIPKFSAIAQESAQLHGEDYIETRRARTEVAGLLSRAGRFDEAIAAFAPIVRALRIPRDWRSAETIARYGTALLRAGRFSEASEQLADALVVYRDSSVKGPVHEDTREVAARLVEALDKSGDPTAAAAVLERLHQDLVNAKQADEAARTAERIADLLDRAGDTAGASRWRSQVREPPPQR